MTPQSSATTPGSPSMECKENILSAADGQSSDGEPPKFDPALLSKSDTGGDETVSSPSESEIHFMSISSHLNRIEQISQSIHSYDCLGNGIDEFKNKLQNQQQTVCRALRSMSKNRNQIREVRAICDSLQTQINQIVPD